MAVRRRSYPCVRQAPSAFARPPVRLGTGLKRTFTLRRVQRHRLGKGLCRCAKKSCAHCCWSTPTPPNGGWSRRRRRAPAGASSAPPAAHSAPAPAERRMVSATASRAGWSVVSASCAESAAGLLQGPHGREVRASLLSSWNTETGPDLIAAMRSVRADLPVIVLADGGSIDQAVAAMRAGASDFLAKPFAPERLMEALSAHRDRRRAAGELAPLSEKLAPE